MDMVAAHHNVDGSMQFDTGNLRTAQLLHIVDIVNMIVLDQAATTWAPPAAYQDGMVGPHWSKGWIIEDCEISNSKCCGISLGKWMRLH